MIQSSGTQVAPENPPRKRRPKTILREQQLKERLADAKRQLQLVLEREQAIDRLGTLAARAGLAPFDDSTLATEFAALARRLGAG